MANGEWRMANGEWRMANGEWRMANGEWRMANGEWRMANGEWRMANGEWPFAIRHSPFFRSHHIEWIDVDLELDAVGMADHREDFAQDLVHQPRTAGLQLKMKAVIVFQAIDGALDR